ncbi:unnamed protein product, partial [Mesorhabditis belari]|uniref:histone acetyltransferase n=1 Tax=Mesorhabditis belari TaxID=2138241 RepID=A0AAF3FK98_9BILA
MEVIWAELASTTQGLRDCENKVQEELDKPELNYENLKDVLQDTVEQFMRADVVMERVRDEMQRTINSLRNNKKISIRRRTALKALSDEFARHLIEMRIQFGKTGDMVERVKNLMLLEMSPRAALGTISEALVEDRFNGGYIEVEPKRIALQRSEAAIIHSSQCKTENCRRLKSCTKIKIDLQHLKTCKRRRCKTGCEDCEPLRRLIEYHAKFCNQRACRVPFCARFRPKLGISKRKVRKILL